MFGIMPALEAGAATSKAAMMAFKGITGLFSAQMGLGAIEKGSDIYKLHKDPNSTTQDFVTAYSGMFTDSAMATLGVLHGVMKKIPERAAKVSTSMEGKTVPQVAEILRQEAVTSEPSSADALSQAAAYFDNLAQRRAGGGHGGQ